VLILPVLLYRRIRYGYAFRRIPLTRGLYAIVDPDDFWRLSRYKWCALQDQSTFYAIRMVYQGKNHKRKTVWMHREIIKAGDDQVCDHINHEGLDNIERQICDWRAVARTHGTGESKRTIAAQSIKASDLIHARRNGLQEYRLPASVNFSVLSTMKSRRRRPMTKRHENITGNLRY
jgi:hypothetical protein